MLQVIEGVYKKNDVEYIPLNVKRVCNNFIQKKRSNSMVS